MLKIQEIREMIKLIDESTIHEFELEQNGTSIKMKKVNGAVQVAENPAPVQVSAPTAVPQTTSQVAPTQEKSVAALEKVAVEPVNEKVENLQYVTSPMVGTFYQASSPDTPPYVQAGSKVTKDSVVCIVEAMKLFNEIEAEVEGEIVEVLVKDGQLVEYGQQLFSVRPI
ncbi:acetyl-CoA carboxylase biotin carboxyl carrier protein [Mangrovibacillus cuniculi]|uniref:Biotin carboxyl carrier protein of acetyl-CoA carboxylase n=1 Tax=Mangrovibacillus cuniculi TaxID=2593652 RepID=A0A7S8CBD5_9BACI|nr:acetyl-CoA carboxylase biotin carboxyl carrier protein [Mangrovibacillus cuniculi]QPC46827.1 acetyl-CoA carboxylase biotin carboxyl carrier protein [Mangrovibacillus cuniculi]